MKSLLRRASRLVRRLDPVTAVAVVVLALGAVQLFAGALEAGVTTDEPIEANEARSWIDHGWYLPDYLLVDGRPDPSNRLAVPFVYGPAFEATAHVANVIGGNEGIGEISSSADAYAVRHLVVAALAALAAAAVAAAAWIFTRSRRFGLWAGAALLAIPEWTGQGFFNPKDTPAACGYTLVTVGLALALREAAGERTPSRRRGIAIGALLAGGVFVGAGTRLSLLAPLLGTVLAYAALRLGQRRLGGLARGGADLAVAAGTGLGLAAIAAVYPNAAATPLELLAKSVSGSSGYPYEGVTLTAGKLLSEHPPWWYLPVWIGASVPLLLGGLAVLGAVLGLRSLLAARGAGWRGAVWRRADLGLLLVLMQALALPLAVIVVGGVAYNGMRQHVYVLPAIAILAGVGAQRLSAWARSRRPRGRWRGAAAALLCLALIAPMIEQTLLFPYNYAYLNPLTAIGGVNGNWETDYYYAAGREALARVPKGAKLLCSRFGVLPGDEDGRPTLESCSEQQLAPFAAERGTDVAPRWRDDTGTWMIFRARAGNRPPSYCEQVDDVTRWLRGEEVVMAYVLRCDPEEAERGGAG